MDVTVFSLMGSVTFYILLMRRRASNRKPLMLRPVRGLNFKNEYFINMFGEKTKPPGVSVPLKSICKYVDQDPESKQNIDQFVTT